MQWTIVVFLVACAGTTGLADQDVTYPELTRGNGVSRIVSGWEAQEGQFPHQLSIRMIRYDGAVFSCGGSLIHHEWGLTAAHCTALRTSFVVRVGTTNLTRPHLIFETTEFYNHPFYIEILPIVQANDISLLKFNRFVEYNDFVKPIRIQRSSAKDRNFARVQLVASGWGALWTSQSGPENLNWVYLQGVTNEFCRATYGSIIQDSTICTIGYNVTSQSTCQGDSGGPLTVVDDDGQLSIVGVTSFVSSQGCDVGLPAGFIRPGHYHEWFYDVTGLDFDWEYIPTTTSPPVTGDVSTDYPSTVQPTTEPSTEQPTIEPSTQQPTTEPATEQPTTEPATEQPTTEPATEQPTTEPSTQQPTTEPATEQPTTEPATEQPSTPSTEQPTTEPSTQQPTTEPATEQPTTEPATEQPSTEPSTEQPTTEPSTQQPTTEPATEQPTTEPATEQPSTEPSTQQPTTEPATEQPTTEPSTQQPTTEPATEQPTTELSTEQPTTTTDPSTEDPTSEPSTEQPTTTIDPSTEDPTTEEPTEAPPTTATSEEDSTSEESESSESSSSSESNETDETEESS